MAQIAREELVKGSRGFVFEGAHGAMVMRIGPPWPKAGDDAMAEAHPML